MAKRSDRPRMTLSEHLALRAEQAAKEQEQAQAREEARLRRMRTIRELEQAGTCTCPACTARRLRLRGRE